MKVLVSAYACDPSRGSEPGVGWNWVRQIARNHEVWAITRTRYRASIERALRDLPRSRVHMTYYDLPAWAAFWQKGERGERLYYSLWQIGALFRARRLHRRIGFDLAHHVTFAVYWYPIPTFLALLPVPFVWGPLGGGDSTPRPFYRTLGLRGRLYEHVRDLARRIGRWSPLVRLTTRRAAVAIAQTEATRRELNRLGSKAAVVFSNTGVSADDFTHGPEPVIGADGAVRPFRMISVGRLLHLKGLHLALDAFARIAEAEPGIEYWIVGDGPERERLERMTVAYGLADRVRFFGWRPRSKVLDLMQSCDVLVHPSLHDSASWVCLEAMAAGRPVVCLDHGGPALQVVEGAGIKIPARTPEQVVEEISAAVVGLARDRDRLDRMREAVRRRALEEFDWDAKGDWIDRVYRTIAHLDPRVHSPVGRGPHRDNDRTLRDGE